MKSLLWVVLIGCLMFLVSCSSSAGGGKWVKPGSGEAEFDEDYSRCKRYVNRECDLTEWPGYLVQKNCIDKLMKECLNSSGWEYQKSK